MEAYEDSLFRITAWPGRPVPVPDVAVMGFEVQVGTVPREISEPWLVTTNDPVQRIVLPNDLALQEVLPLDPWDTDGQITFVKRWGHMASTPLEPELLRITLPGETSNRVLPKEDAWGEYVAPIAHISSHFPPAAGRDAPPARLPLCGRRVRD